MKKIIPLCLMLLGTSAFAANTTANTQSSAKLESMCQINAINSINFGQIFNLNINDTSFPLVLRCSKSVNYTIFTNQVTENSPNPSGATSFSHKMAAQNPGNTDYLIYNLYRDSSYITVIGSGATVNPVGGASYGTSGLNGTGTGANFTHTIYLRQYGARNFNDPLRGLATPDTYTGSVTFTLTY